jgi:putative transposase
MTMPHIELTDRGTFPSYDRRLPHRHPEGFAIFFTWNLDGAIPAAVLKEKEIERIRLENQPLRVGESARDRKIRHDKIVFVLEDRRVGTNPDGPHHLRDPRAARIVVDSILWGVPQRYELYAFVVMSNHVHLLIIPSIVPKKITQGIKGFTSFRINELHDAKGRTFWQHESYDHWARDEAEMHRIIAYIENNSVEAGLCAKAEDWPWSSAAMRGDWPIGKPWKKPTAG